jgi:hypothetical protein
VIFTCSFVSLVTIVIFTIANRHSSHLHCHAIHYLGLIGYSSP